MTRLPPLSRKWLPFGLCLLVLAGCGSDKAAAPAQPQAVPAGVITVTATDVPFVGEFVGETESSQEVEIRARVEGFLEQIAYREGSLVNKGDVLFQMDRKPFEAALSAARAELQAQQARLGTASANLKRVGPLAAEDALSQKDLDDAQGSRDAAVAAVEGARSRVQQAEINLSYTTILSPVTGVTSFARKQPGSFIAPGPDSLLTYVSALDPMRVNFSVSENEQLKFNKLVKKASCARRTSGSTRCRSCSPTAPWCRRRATSRSATPRSTRKPAPSWCAPSCPTRTACCGRASSSAC